MMQPNQEAAAILTHYFKALAERAGLKWLPANSADMSRLADLLSGPQASDTIAPYLAPAAEPRTTVVLEQPRERTPEEWAAVDPRYVEWQRRRQYDEAEEAAGMLRRNGGGR